MEEQLVLWRELRLQSQPTLTSNKSQQVPITFPAKANTTTENANHPKAESTNLTDKRRRQSTARGLMYLKQVTDILSKTSLPSRRAEGFCDARLQCDSVEESASSCLRAAGEQDGPKAPPPSQQQPGLFSSPRRMSP
ncbi:hypothetical protein GN956_G93 [Arapaima gigas]